ncbi:tetratricopeptide repeat protein [Burkholderia cepacia]|uniref:tetratricopeptide repeat protein n=1 Tax=Burkholderia cepacia TaxID=292 RepID=UPI0015885814|nr:hypothetical protein [Burkholderia cepacia]
MKVNRKYLFIALTMLIFGTAPSAHAQHEHSGGENLGKVNFAVACNSEAQSDFNVAMAYYYSFDWSKINSATNRVLQDDQKCGMAYWLKALSSLNNPFAWPSSLPASAVGDGSAALDAARKTGLGSQRERDYVDALSVYFKDADKIDHRTRAVALESAFGRLAEKYPNDSEASVLYALILSANSDPADKKYVRQLKAVSILEPIFQKQPNHPGTAHFLIHSYDYPFLAKRGLDVARLYAKIAPSAPHALHMPSHIFSRLGLWKESIASNRAAYAAAREGTLQAFHFSDFMVYAYLQLGDVNAARQIMDQARARKVLDDLGASYPYAAMPARIAIETDSWKDAANLELSPPADSYPWKKYPQSEAVNAFARGVGAAMSGDPEKAHFESARLISLRDVALAMKMSYWAEQIDIEAQIVRGLAVFADGKHDDGIMVLRDAAEREDATEKSAVTAGPIVTAREMLATMLLQTGHADEALMNFKRVLEVDPNRHRSLVGAIQSAEKAGDTKAATTYSKQLEDSIR